MLRARNVGVRYGARHAVRSVSLEAHAGEVLALVGANGSGKSSLIRALARLQAHTGDITWDGRAPPPGAVGYMPQDSGGSARLTAFEVVLLGRMRTLTHRVSQADLEAANAVMHEVGVVGYAERRIGELSGGQRQMVLMAQVLVSDPRALLLDEPTSALDIAHQVHVLGLLRAMTRSRGLTTIVVLHDLNAAARFADRIALLHAGRLTALGPPSQVLRAATLDLAFDVHVAIDKGSDGYPVVLPLRARAP